MSKTKGTQYIAKQLVKYFKSKYGRYKDALPRAREILTDIKSKNEKVTLKAIFARERKSRGSKAIPFIDPTLFEEHYYFDLINFPAYIMRCSNEVWFISPLFKKGEEIQGGTYPDYDTYFSPFVTHCNILAKGYDASEKRYDTQWNVTCKPAYYDKAKKRWEVKIIAIDDKGTEYDYGFNPDAPDSTVEISKQTTSTPVSAPVTQNIQQTQADVRKQQEIDEKKQDNIKTVLQLFAEGKLTKQEVKELIGIIKS